MASNIVLVPLPTTSPRFQISRKQPRKSYAVSVKADVEEKKRSLSCRAVRSEEVTDDENTAESSVRAQLDLLEQLTSSTIINRGNGSDGDAKMPTIREQLIELTRRKNGDFTLPLDKKMKEGLKNLNIFTVSQRRNIKRQTYLNVVARRNDVAFFAMIGAFVVLPPLVILAVAIQTGYIQLFPR